MKVTIIPIVIGAFGTVTKGLLKGLEDLEGRITIDNGVVAWFWGVEFDMLPYFAVVYCL